ncbi:MAG: hypothetical protein P4L87_16990 [Formivibrio sp.]|nr:hypothetical protein [Formivibrio sp.]MDR3539816.1 hypothetical protein [Desulfosporosinus sp.]
MFQKLKFVAASFAIGIAGLLGSAAAMADDPSTAVITAVTTGATTVSANAITMLTAIVPIAIGVLAAVMVFRFGKRLISGLV